METQLTGVDVGAGRLNHLVYGNIDTDVFQYRRHFVERNPAVGITVVRCEYFTKFYTQHTVSDVDVLSLVIGV